MNILITREKDKTAKFASMIKEEGHTPFSLPMIDCVPVEADITGHYDYGIFTSLNAVRYFQEYRDKVTFDKIVSVGPATGELLEDFGMRVDMMPEKYSAEGLKKLFSDIDVASRKFLMAGAETRAGDFHKWLKDNRADADVASIYRTEAVKYEEGYVENFLAEKSIDIVTFASPSAVRAFFDNIDIMPDIRIICIGKTTYDAVKEMGYESDYPEDYTLDGMMELIRKI
jgi:uroporphyrinogen-III synthase